MEGEKYIGKRVKALERSGAPLIMGMLFRVAVVLALLLAGYLSCEGGLKFVESHPELDYTQTQ